MSCCNDFSYGKDKRLTSSVDYKSVFKDCKKTRYKYFTVYAKRIFDKDKEISPRLGIVISKRNVKTAVNRNRIKRIIREKFRLEVCSFSSFDIIVTAFKDASVAKNSEIVLCLEKLFTNLRKPL